MVSLIYANAVVIDTSAAVAIVDENDRMHDIAIESLAEMRQRNVLCAVDVTAHESFTRLRYNRDLLHAEMGYAFLRDSNVSVLEFEFPDEDRAIGLIRKYNDKVLSFHDALCAAVMLRLGLFRVFSFDSDFWSFGFEVSPGQTHR